METQDQIRVSPQPFNQVAEYMTARGDNGTAPSTAAFLQATAHEQWLTVPELVASLTRAGYWTLRGLLDEGERAAHVRSQLANLRDANGRLVFESVDVRAGDAVTQVYKQARLLRRGHR